MGTIVVAYDGSEPAQRALDRAADLAVRYEDQLVVTSVIPVWVAGDPSGTPGPELQEAGAKLTALGIEHELFEAIGDPSQAIVEVGDRRGAQLIVVGTREPGLVERMLRMSVSEQVQRQARCDVLIVH